ncbi:hypothetical protein CPC16_011519 [Podila verticillata]|nr:hypothetical protein CPC16_011519 [Podila verticillata]
MKLLYVVLTFTAVASPFVHAATNCATGPTMMTDIQYFAMGDAISFCPSNICISVIGKLNSLLVAGSKAKFSISAKVGGKEVYTSVQDFCSLIGVCPSSSGFMILPVPETTNFPAHVMSRASLILDVHLWHPRSYHHYQNHYQVSYSNVHPSSSATKVSRVEELSQCHHRPSCHRPHHDPWELLPPPAYTLTVTVPMSAPITDGATLFITGRFIGSVIYRDEADLCELLAAAGTPCPVPATATSWSVERTVKNAPANIPLAYTMSAVNVNGNTLFCRQTTISAKNCTITA